jgi:hypothetical protein
MPIPVEGMFQAKVLSRGKVAEHNPMTNIRSYAAEDVDIGFGYGVMDGTDAEKQVKVYSSASGKFRGVAIQSTEASDLDNSDYQDHDQVAVMDQGVVWVYCEEAVNVGDAVRVRHTSGVPGAFRTTASAGNSVLLTGAEWRSDALSGTTAKLFLSPPFTITADT